MRAFTLDTNCIVGVDEKRADEEPFVRALAHAHANATADVSVVAISASEKQQDGSYIKDFGTFQARLERLELQHLGLLMPMGYWDIGFYGFSLWCGDEMKMLEERIHKILFPNDELNWPNHCRAKGLDVNSLTSDDYITWRNRKCDVQAMWCHIYNKRDVFVTTDGRFFRQTKKSALLALGAGRIERPRDAIALI